MSLFGGGASISTEEPRLLALRVSQSAYGAAIPRVWGTQRVPGNLLGYYDFTPVAHTTTQSSGGGGKGGGGVESTNTSYTYTAAVMLALCTGTVVGVGTVWSDKATTTLAALGLTLKTGALGQATWSHLTAHHAGEAIGYSGIAYVASAALDLGGSSSLPNLSFEVQGERIIGGGNGDAEPADIVADIITDTIEGIGLPASILGDDADYRAWCDAMALTLSLAATAQRPASEYLADILRATLSDVVWSQGRLRYLPYGDHPVGAWTPNTTPVYDIGEGDLLAPPLLRRKQPADAVNRVTVTYSDRDNDYNTVPVTRDDLTAVSQYGPKPVSHDLPAITGSEMAATVAEFWRDRELYIRNSWEFPLDERFCLLEPGDLLTLTYAPQALDHVAVCVVEVAEADEDAQAELTVLVEEWPFGLARPTVNIPAAPGGYVPESSVAPGAVNTPAIFEAPNALTAPNLELWIAASGGVHWGGCHVWVSDDGTAYQQIGTIANPARHGTLTALLAAGADPDTTHTLAIDMLACGGQLLSGTTADADNGNTLLWVDGELISYQTATLTSAGHYDLTYLRRGREGTPIASHSSSAKFARLDDAIFRYVVPRARIGSGIWIKLQSFNQFGKSVEPLDTVTAYTHTLAGNAPLPLAALTATGGLFENALSWTFAADQVGIDFAEIWGATVNNRASALPLTSQKRNVLAWKHPGLQPAQTWYYWGRVIDTSTNESAFYPAGATAGVAATTSSDPSALLTQLEGAIGTDQLAAELAVPIGDIPGMQGDITANATAITSEATARASADSALSSSISTVSAVANSKIKTYSQTTAPSSGMVAGDLWFDSDDNNKAYRYSGSAWVATDDARIATNAAAITSEATARASADSALSSSISTVAARLDTGDFAAVKTESSANASAIAGVEARWGVQVQTMADGVRAMAGLTLLAGGDGESVVGILADKFLIYKPDGSGTPKQVVTLGLINGVTTLALDGNLVVDGSIITRTLQANAVTNTAAAASGSVGSVADGADIITVSYTSVGSPVLISIATTAQKYLSAQSNFTGVLEVWRDGYGYKLQAFEFTMANALAAYGDNIRCVVAGALIDTPATGAVVYRLKNKSGVSLSFGGANITIAEFKR